ncbi:Methyltransferase domain-containing protein [Lentzea fradiae]|uniref:Methyltransferase domain-containing protein n=1 Tax=Lentzea fradiae TaxID=200378 RepID=A0A1G7R1R5_9PSEU|nr:class I SAM-dependent methyltransferase [Lentzea fradiae]SDG04654.1 Methyltransferase domain-containing protein [Lentzea fradiae]
MTTPVTFWDNVHGTPRTTAPRPNVRLIETVTALPPGEALDLGCGQGGDALWLARQGWRVTSADISAVAVEKLTTAAATHGLTDQVTAHRHDLHDDFPTGTYDLVNAHYLHTPFTLDRAQVFRKAANSLRPGGTLLIVDHGSAAPWSWDQNAHFPTPREVAAEIDLDPSTWSTIRADSPTRTATGPDGSTAEVVDHVLVIRRNPR